MSPLTERCRECAISSLTVGLRCSSGTLTRLRNGSISWLRAGTEEWVKIVAFSGSIAADELVGTLDVRSDRADERFYAIDVDAMVTNLLAGIGTRH